MDALAFSHPSVTFDEQLRRLAEIYFRHQAGLDMPLIKVRVLLNSGTPIQGYVVNYGNGCVSILEREERTDADRLFHVNLSAIAAISHEWSQQTADLLILKNELPAVERPSRLEMLRRLREIAGHFSSRSQLSLNVNVDDDLQSQEHHYTMIMAIYHDIFTSLDDIASDNLGKKALASITDIIIKNGEQAAIERHASQITVIANFEQRRRLNQQQLHQALQDQL